MLWTFWPCIRFLAAILGPSLIPVFADAQIPVAGPAQALAPVLIPVPEVYSCQATCGSTVCTVAPLRLEEKLVNAAQQQVTLDFSLILHMHQFIFSFLIIIMHCNVTMLLQSIPPLILCQPMPLN